MNRDAAAGSSALPLPRGVTIERTFAGLEVRLRPAGIGRFFSAAFLAVWLIGWTAGECFALWLLGKGAWALVTGDPPEPGRGPLVWGPALGVGAFLIIWTAVWTLGGFAALHEFLRLLWGEDRLCASSRGLEVARRAGFIVRRKLLPRERLRRLYRVQSALMAETLDGPVELTKLGPVRHEALVAALAAELRLPDPATMPAGLPGDWQEVNAPEGGKLLVKDVVTRRRQVRVAWSIALLLWAGTALLIDAARREPSLITLAVVALALTAAVSWGAAWLQFGRTEWRIEPGRVIQQRRMGSRVRRQFEGTSVVLSESRDSDNDAWYAVEIATLVAPHATPGEQRRARRTVFSRIHDPTEPRRIAEWLAHQAEIPLRDSIPTPAAKAADAEALLRQLEGSGRFGNWAARMIRSKVQKQPD